jgi:hypothetical protein
MCNLSQFERRPAVGRTRPRRKTGLVVRLLNRKVRRPNSGSHAGSRLEGWKAGASASTLNSVMAMARVKRREGSATRRADRTCLNQRGAFNRVKLLKEGNHSRKSRSCWGSGGLVIADAVKAVPVARQSFSGFSPRGRRKHQTRPWASTSINSLLSTIASRDHQSALSMIGEQTLSFQETARRSA